MTMLLAFKTWAFKTWMNSRRTVPGKAAKERLDATGERLIVRRRQHLRQGFVSLPTRPAFPPQLCRVEDVSFNGVSIALDQSLPDPGILASGVRLYLSAEDVEVDCRVAWQKGDRLGLQFQGKPQPSSRTYR